MAKQIITKDMTFGEVLNKYPEVAEVLMKHGLHCIGCHFAFAETIEQGARGHGMDDKQLAEMVKDANEIASKAKPKGKKD